MNPPFYTSLKISLTVRNTTGCITFNCLIAAVTLFYMRSFLAVCSRSQSKHPLTSRIQNMLHLFQFLRHQFLVSAGFFNTLTTVLVKIKCLTGSSLYFWPSVNKSSTQCVKFHVIEFSLLTVMCAVYNLGEKIIWSEWLVILGTRCCFVIYIFYCFLLASRFQFHFSDYTLHVTSLGNYHGLHNIRLHSLN